MKGSIQKQGKNRYFIVFGIIDPETGKRKQKWVSAGRTRRAAEEKYVELIGDIKDGTYRELKPATFQQFAENEWLPAYEGKLKPSTFSSYSNIIRKHFNSAFGNKLLIEIDTPRLQRYVTDRGKEVKPKTVINEIVPMKLIFEYAVKWGYLKIDPAEHVERPKYEKEEMKILSPDEIRAFFRCVTPIYFTFFLTAMLTGMRRGELLGLQWGDIDWNHKQIHVKRALDNTTKQLSTTKTQAGKRKIDMSPYLVLGLREYQLERGGKGDDDPVFCNDDGTPWNADSLVRRQFLPALKRAGVKRVRFHDLRHSYASLQIETGANIVYISKQQGHASVKTTLDVYGYLMKEAYPEQAVKLDRALGFVEQSGSPSEGVRYLLGNGPKTKKTGLQLQL